MTKLEIIEELFDNYYCKDPSRRAKEGHNCVYRTNEEIPRYCAVGMCLTKKGVDIAMKRRIGGVYDFSDNNIDLEKILKKKYQGHESRFWKNLQNLHDESENWTPEVLTEIGKEELNRLKKLYA